jgi:hypothetical protein
LIISLEQKACTVFKVFGYLDFAPDRPGVMVPVFSKIGTNIPYVQSLDEFYQIEEFFPYFQYEEFGFVSESRVFEADVGEGGLIAFRSPAQEIICGGTDAVLFYLENKEYELEKAPLLKLQLLRIANAPLAQQYEIWRLAAERYFENKDQQAHWLDAELLTHQSNDRIWKRIKDKKSYSGPKHPSMAQKMRAVDPSDPEQRIVLLSDPQYYDFVGWDLEWFILKSQLPVDERVYLIANDWLYAVFSSNIEIAKTKNVLADVLKYWRSVGVVDDQFLEFLIELLQSGSFFSDELGLSNSALLAALYIIERNSHPDYIAVLLSVLGGNYFPEQMMEALLLRLNDATRLNEEAEGLRSAEESEGKSFWDLSSRPDFKSWRDVALENQENLKAVLEKAAIFDASASAFGWFIAKWEPMLKRTARQSFIDERL